MKSPSTWHMKEHNESRQFKVLHLFVEHNRIILCIKENSFLTTINKSICQIINWAFLALQVARHPMVISMSVLKCHYQSEFLYSQLEH